MTSQYEPGTPILLGKYRLENVIGEGGMGTVWRAVHTTLHSPVAVKFVDVTGPDADELTERFLREAQLAASVRHRMVVDILDFGQMTDGQPFMIMEFLEGETLGQRLEREPPLTTDEVVAVFARLLRGLSAVHDAGIVHRDLKPENIQLIEDADGYFPKLTDFGISRVKRSPSSEPPPAPGEAPRIPRPPRRSAVTTREGHVVGTPEYMSPEQARGIKDLDKRTDIFSVGVMLYEVLTGRLPFGGAGIGDILINIITEDPVPPATYGVPEQLCVVIDKAMSKDREDRYQSAEELRDALLDAAEVISQIHDLVPLRTAPPTAGPRAIADAIETLSSEVEAPSKSRGVLVTLGVIALIGGAAAVIFGTGVGTEVDVEAETNADPASMPVEPEPIAAPVVVEEPEPEPVPVAVTLQGVPEDAVVTVDGMPVDAQPIPLLADSEVHRIEVSVDGFLPWSVEHVADADGRYTVEMEPEMETSRETRGGRMMRSRRGMTAPAMGMLLRELDF